MNNIERLQPQYIIFINNGFYVYKLIQYRNIKTYQLTQDQFFNIVDACQFEDKNILQDFSKQDYYFKTIEQCYDYFVKNVGMQLNQFQQLFNTDYSDYEQFEYNGINIKVARQFDRKNDVKKTIDIIKQKIKADIFNNMLVVFDDIVQRDSSKVHGNRVNNQYGFDNVLHITSYNMLYDFLHELGHIYQDKYLTFDQLQDIYDFITQHQYQIDSNDDYFLNYDQCVPQLFALYYDDQLSEKINKFIEDKILKF